MIFQTLSAGALVYLILYGCTAMANFIAALYLLFRRGNAFAPAVTPPLRLRRWAASFFAAAMLSHVWWLFFFIFSGKILSVAHVATALFDSVTLLTTIAGTLLAMLQDRRRPVWPLMVAMLPFVALGALLVVSPSPRLMHILKAYLLLAYAVFTVYMVFAVRQYGRWLRDNYADLENKRVWLSQSVIIGTMLLFVFYANDDGDLVLGYFMMLIEPVLFGLLLWRVETLPQLGDMPVEEAACPAPSTALGAVGEGGVAGEADVAALAPPVAAAEPAAAVPPTNIDIAAVEQLLDEHCVATRLYLQHDLTLAQLAKTIGSNRTYLSQYFSVKGTTYNAYISDQRIRHFTELYRKAVEDKQHVTAQQLASLSGYRSYSTFSLAFKQRMGLSVTAWMRSQ